MNCPKCNLEMEKGFTDGGLWAPARIRIFPGFLKKTLVSGQLIADAWLCRNCGKIELYVEDHGNKQQ